jgi:hypothetical protein
MLANLQGARTYIIAVLIALMGVWTATDELLTFLNVADLPPIPDWVLILLGGGAVASTRASIQNAEDKPPVVVERVVVK